MKAKNWIVVVATLLALATTGLSAQTKYEFATLRCFPKASINMKELNGITLTTKDGIRVINKRPNDPYVEFEKKATELSAEGWEIYQATTTASLYAWYSYHLRRKIDSERY